MLGLRLGCCFCLLLLVSRAVAVGNEAEDGHLSLLQRSALFQSQRNGSTWHDASGNGSVQFAGALGSLMANGGLQTFGVNLGGWLHLEDWFFSGAAGRFVASRGIGQGACLPPNVAHLDAPWSDEGDLTRQLNSTRGSAETVKAFIAHRDAYIGDLDFERIAALGVRHVRLPITWAAFADALAPLDASVYGAYDPETEATVVPDPYYKDSRAFVTVPRARLKSILGLAAAHGLRVLFDVHSLPGGCSNGTFSGVWPLQPAFWSHNTSVGSGSAQLSETGIWVTSALIRWVENLDTQLQKAVLGLSFMNEPAHNAWVDRSHGHPFATESQVLEWFARAGELFRSSKLPSLGVRLYVNIIESAFKDFHGTVLPWWSSSFSLQERSSWAVIDRHRYTAWTDDCAGSTDPSEPETSYTCQQPVEEVRPVIRKCMQKWAAEFAGGFEGLRAASEFSLVTKPEARLQCRNDAVLRSLFEEQVAAFKERNIEAFFWTWRMPYGPNFEAGWSLKHLVGLEDPTQPEACVSGTDPSSSQVW